MSDGRLLFRLGDVTKAARSARVLALSVTLVLGGCAATSTSHHPVRPPTSSKPAKTTGEDAFWQTIEDARRSAQGDPDAMADVLTDEFANASDDTLRDFQRQLVAASRRLYTCGTGDDSFLILEPGDLSPSGTPPSGYPMSGTDPLRGTLPRVARRI